MSVLVSHAPESLIFLSHEIYIKLPVNRDAGITVMGCCVCDNRSMKLVCEAHRLRARDGQTA